MSPRSLPLLMTVIGIAAFILDRSLKYLARSGVTIGPVEGGIRFELLPNPAIGFSVAFPPTLSLVVIPLIILLFVYAGVRLYRRRDWVRTSIIGTIVLAASSNYLDRIQYGYVIDYVSIGSWFPVFNLSDVVIASSVLLLISLPRFVNAVNRDS